MRALVILCLLVLGALAPVYGQPTGPNVLPPTGPKPMVAPAWIGPQLGLPVLTPDAPGAPHYLFTANGQCIWWYAYGATIKQFVYCGTVAELPKVGGRVNTIRNAADPLASLLTLRRRIAMSDLTCAGLVCSSPDPDLQAIVADLNAARAR